MLRIGLTGGIGAGKSTVSRVFSDCGAVIVDGDVISREVVAPGSHGLGALVDEFGSDILLPDGALNRPALAAKAFVDETQRAKLNAIVHPLVAHRRAELVAAAASDAVVVEDIPLLVESGMAPLFPLVVVVHADSDLRLRRLTEQRGMDEADARARIAAQATEAQRRAVADVWLDNSGTEAELIGAARALWGDRIVPFARHLAAKTPAPDPVGLVPADPTWSAQAARITARLAATCGHRALRIDHIGSTAVPGLDARDIIDVQVTVASLEDADALADALLAAGYPRVSAITADSTPEGLQPKIFHASADGGRPTHIHIRPDGAANQRFGLLFVDWLCDSPAARADYLAVKRGRDRAALKSWFAAAHERAQLWAQSTGWSPRAVS